MLALHCIGHCITWCSAHGTVRTHTHHITTHTIQAPQSNDADIAGTWVSGITEVAVPVKYKLENVEAAEAAKKAMMGHGYGW